MNNKSRDSRIPRAAIGSARSSTNLASSAKKPRGQVSTSVRKVLGQRNNGPFSSEHRGSMIPQSASSQASIKDKRDIRSKAFIDSATGQIMDFLTSNNLCFDSIDKILANPHKTTRDVYLLLEYMISFLLGGISRAEAGKVFVLDMKNRPEDQLISVLKDPLQYPFALSRQTFMSPNTPHGWPQILAVLDWLHRQICYRSFHNLSDLVPIPASEFEQGVSSTNSVAFLKICNLKEAHQRFLNCKDDSWKKVATEPLEAEAKMLKKLLAQRAAELARLTEIKQSKIDAGDPVLAAQNELNKVRKENAALMKEKKRLEEKENDLIARTSEVVLRQNEVKEVIRAEEEDIARKKKIVAEQPFTEDEVFQYKKQKKNLEFNIKTVTANIEEFRKKNEADQFELANKFEEARKCFLNLRMSAASLGYVSELQDIRELTSTNQQQLAAVGEHFKALCEENSQRLFATNKELSEKSQLLADLEYELQELNSTNENLDKKLVDAQNSLQTQQNLQAEAKKEFQSCRLLEEVVEGCMNELQALKTKESELIRRRGLLKEQLAEAKAELARTQESVEKSQKDFAELEEFVNECETRVATGIVEKAEEVCALKETAYENFTQTLGEASEQYPEAYANLMEELQARGIFDLPEAE